MDFDFTKIIVVIVTIAAVILDWPRALAGLVVGFAGRRWTAYPKIAIPLGVLIVAALGEVIYPLIGRTAEANMGSFLFGLLAAGITAYGLLSWIGNIFDNM